MTGGKREIWDEGGERMSNAGGEWDEGGWEGTRRDERRGGGTESDEWKCVMVVVAGEKEG